MIEIVWFFFNEKSLGSWGRVRWTEGTLDTYESKIYQSYKPFDIHYSDGPKQPSTEKRIVIQIKFPKLNTRCTAGGGETFQETSEFLLTLVNVVAFETVDPGPKLSNCRA